MSLSNNRIQEIENITRDLLLEMYGSSEKIPSQVDLAGIADKYGLKTYLAEFANENIAGYFDKNKMEIFLNKHDPISRRRFTLAHELGHFFLHSNKVSETYYRTDAFNLSIQDKQEEQEANWFASSLLIPKHKAIFMASVTNRLQELSSLFGVSNATAGFRYRNLGLEIA